MMEITELQTVIENLAKGINYYTGEIAGDYEIINDVKISRALFEVNDILKGLVPKEAKKPKKPKKSKFVYDEAIIATVKIESMPTSVSQIARNVVAAYNGECKLSYNDITPLLQERGILIENPDESKPKLIASPAARQYGITNHRTTNAYNIQYWQTVYNEDGQRYVLELLKELGDKEEEC